MSDGITGRGFWDVVDDHFMEIGTIAIIGLVVARFCWQDWVVASTTERIAMAKLATSKKKKTDTAAEEEQNEDSETF